MAVITQLPMSASPPGAVALIYGLLGPVPPPGTDQGEWESGTEVFFSGPSQQPSFTRNAEPLGPLVGASSGSYAGPYVILGPGQWPGYKPLIGLVKSPLGAGYAPGSSPWWMTEEPEEGEYAFCYAGPLGYDATQFYTDWCPNGGGHVHRFYQMPNTEMIDGRVYGKFICYAGPVHAMPILILFAGPGVPCPGSILTAIAGGSAGVVGS